MIAFGDFKNYLLKQGVTLPKTNEIIQKLFNLMSEDKPDVLRHTVERIIEFEPNPSTSRPGQTQSVEKRLPTPPPAFTDLAIFLVKNDHNIMVDFKDCVSAKRIPENRFV